MISVVVPARDAADLLPGQLRALAAQHVDEEFEVVVADNGSTDATVAVARSWRDQLPGLRVVDASGRPGVCHARNSGAAAATGRHLLFCDADDEAAPGWIAAMSAALEESDVVGGRLDRRRLSPTASLRATATVSEGLTPWPGFLPFASGATLGVRADVLQDLGGFDESFVAGGDDVDLSWRAQLAGHRIGFAGDAVMHYRERIGRRAIVRQSYGYGVQDAHLHQRYASSGMPGTGVRTAARSWGHLLVQAPRYARTPPGRSQWLRSASRRLGRVVGSARYRVLYL